MITVSYDTLVISENQTVEHRDATSIYFLNRTNQYVVVADITINPGETFDLFKNQVGEKITTSFNVTIPEQYSYTDVNDNKIKVDRLGNLMVIYEFKTQSK